MSDDRIHREGVLMFLLHETHLVTVEEVVAYRQTFISADLDREYRDGTERAVKDLAAVGVLNVEGRSVYASRAARETASLIEGEPASWNRAPRSGP